VQPEEYRRMSYEAWQATAPGWERWRADLEEALTPVREWLIGALAPQPGDTVLELAAGAGDTGFAAAALVGDEGRLISTDFAPEMVEVARRRGAELGLRNVDYRVMDAERMELPADAVDGVLCQSGYMLMADQAAALAETRRVLRPDGRLALSVWGAPDRNAWVSLAGRILAERGHLPPPEPDAPGIFSMASEERTRGLLESAGFAVVRTDHVPIQVAFRDVDEYEEWGMAVGGTFGMVLRALPESERHMLKEGLGRAFEPFRADGGYVLPGVALTALAT
jgi:SAM-dependent methyltransferase